MPHRQSVRHGDNASRPNCGIVGDLRKYPETCDRLSVSYMPDPDPREEASTEALGAERQEQVGDVELIYAIEGKPVDAPLFELSRTLEALGNVLQEGNRIINHPFDRLVVKVRPFREGSFVMDLVLSIQNNPALLFFLTHPEAIERIKKVLEYVGLINKGREIFASLLELIEHLKNGKPAKIEQAGPDTFNYHNNQGQVMPVTGIVHKLINNGTIQNFIFPAVGAPLQRIGVDAVSAYLPEDPEHTRVKIPKEELPALQAFSAPEPDEPKEEIVENVTTEFLNPKAGTYGETADAVWKFTRAGTKANQISATISDPVFLGKYERGVIRFYYGDVLKVRLKQEQRLKNGKARVKYDIIEVLGYTKAQLRRQRKA